MIEAKNLVKVFGNTTVVNGINLSVNNGDIFGFLGKNGAGKSTTIGMLTGIIKPTSGDISILGTPYGNLNKVKNKIGVLPDISNYYNNMTAFEHLKFLSKLKGIKLSKAEIIETLKLVGLGGAENKKVSKFSFGMKKKLGIAQAIMGEPELIFLDEPTSGLDIQSAYEIQKIISTLKQKNQTVFLTSHNLGEVEKLCSRIAILDRGNLACCGTLEELRDKYQNNINARMRIGATSQSVIDTFANSIKDMVSQIRHENDIVFMDVREEKLIPLIIKNAVKEGIDIYKFEVEQMTLEEIFIQS